MLIPITNVDEGDDCIKRYTETNKKLDKVSSFQDKISNAYLIEAGCTDNVSNDKYRVCLEMAGSKAFRDVTGTFGYSAEDVRDERDVAYKYCAKIYKSTNSKRIKEKVDTLHLMTD